MRSFIRSTVLALGLVGGLSAAACSSAPQDDADTSTGAATVTQKGDLLDVNDVSILFGLAADKPFPELSVVGDGLLPKDVVDQITGSAKKLAPPIQFSSGGDDASKWRVFAMRLDTCAPGINTAFVGGDLTKCSVQVRLIAQPIGQGSPQDISMHIVYTIDSLDKANVEDIRADIMKIKTASVAAGAPTDGQPLGVHPGLAKSDAGVGSAVSGFIKKYAAKQKSLAIAFMGLQADGAEPWQFFAGAVVPLGGNPTFLNLSQVPGQKMPNLPAGSTNVVFQPFASPIVSPQPVNLSTATLFANQGKPDTTSIAFQIENPAQTHFFTTDCVSCHTATQKGVSLQTKSNSNRARVPAGITGYVSPTIQQNSSWNLRNFGYFSTSPSVSLRTVNETVEVVQFMNKNHRVKNDPASTSFEGPGNDCTKVDDAVFNCFLLNQDGKGGSSCMATNKCIPFPLDASPVPKASAPAPVPPLADPSKDPCLSGPEKSGLQVTATTITMTGDATQCFSRTFGAFHTTAGPAIAIVCTAGANCALTLPSTSAPTTLSGQDASRLSASLGKGSSSHSFTTTTKDGVLTIACKGADASATCTITPPAAK